MLNPAHPVTFPINLLPFLLSSITATSWALGTPPPPKCHVPVTTTSCQVHVPKGAFPFLSAGTNIQLVKKCPLPSLTQCPAVVMTPGCCTVAEQTKFPVGSVKKS